MKIDFVVLLLSLVVVFGVVEAKTTDELIEEAEKLLGSAPHVGAAPPAPAAAPAPKAAYYRQPNLCSTRSKPPASLSI